MLLNSFYTFFQMLCMLAKARTGEVCSYYLAHDESILGCNPVPRTCPNCTKDSFNTEKNHFAMKTSDIHTKNPQTIQFHFSPSP